MLSRAVQRCRTARTLRKRPGPCGWNQVFGVVSVFSSTRSAPLADALTHFAVLKETAKGISLPHTVGHGALSRCARTHIGGVCMSTPRAYGQLFLPMLPCFLRRVSLLFSTKKTRPFYTMYAFFMAYAHACCGCGAHRGGRW
jgi:hypothetical protein